MEGIDDLDGRVVSGAFGPEPTDEDVHGALRTSGTPSHGVVNTACASPT